MSSKMWGELTYPFPNLKLLELGNGWISNFMTQFTVDGIIHVSKMLNVEAIPILIQSFTFEASWSGEHQ